MIVRDFNKEIPEIDETWKLFFAHSAIQMSQCCAD
jgi:hypothetical protein